jgi:hypothetical protein
VRRSRARVRWRRAAPHAKGRTSHARRAELSRARSRRGAPACYLGWSASGTPRGRRAARSQDPGPTLRSTSCSTGAGGRAWLIGAHVATVRVRAPHGPRPYLFAGSVSAPAAPRRAARCARAVDGRAASSSASSVRWGSSSRGAGRGRSSRPAELAPARWRAALVSRLANCAVSDAVDTRAARDGARPGGVPRRSRRPTPPRLSRQVADARRAARGAGLGSVGAGRDPSGCGARSLAANGGPRGSRRPRSPAATAGSGALSRARHVKRAGSRGSTAGRRFVAARRGALYPFPSVQDGRLGRLVSHDRAMKFLPFSSERSRSAPLRQPLPELPVPHGHARDDRRAHPSPSSAFGRPFWASRAPSERCPRDDHLGLRDPREGRCSC